MLCNVQDFDLPRSKLGADPGFIRRYSRYPPNIWWWGGGGGERGEPTCYESDKMGPILPVKTELTFRGGGGGLHTAGFPLGLEKLENLEKWEGIFQSGKSQGILNRLEKSGKSQGKPHQILEN